MPRFVHKIGDIIQVNIGGTITNCIVVGDFSYKYALYSNENYIDCTDNTPNTSFKILKFDWGDDGDLTIFDCYKVLIGDQKVYIEECEIYEQSS